MDFKTKISLIISIILVVVFVNALIFIPSNAQTSQVGQLPTYLQDVVNEKTYTDFSEKAANEIKFFKGEDKSGFKLIELLAVLKTTEYSIEGIVTPSDYGWYTIKNYINEEEIYTVGYILNSPDGIQEFIWSYNKNTNSISALNEPARKILDVLNTHD